MLIAYCIAIAIAIIILRGIYSALDDGIRAINTKYNNKNHYFLLWRFLHYFRTVFIHYSRLLHTPYKQNYQDELLPFK